MNTSAHIGVMQTHQAQPDVRTSRIRALRILGGLQISLGILCGILGIVGAILSGTEMKSGCKLYNIYDSYNRYVYMSSYHRCGQSNTILIIDLIGMAFSGWVDLNSNTRSVVAMSSLLTIFSFSEFVISIVAAAHCCCCSQLSTGNVRNQQGYNQMYMPQMQGINGQQPANMPNYPQQGGYSQGNQIPIQGNYGQQSQAFAMANQQQNINAQHTMAPAVDKN
ncbi:unnamed protein product [Mytilus coruscus]|uniref:Uncharacterized protein n=1 Tax=Mytilus coruscus TaxID=42192 RepID=A0A6J8CT25_MYTCO|nr:unnamed protein product [Mytilus coruscus]